MLFAFFTLLRRNKLFGLVTHTVLTMYRGQKILRQVRNREKIEKIFGPVEFCPNSGQNTAGALAMGFQFHGVRFCTFITLLSILLLLTGGATLVTRPRDLRLSTIYKGDKTPV